MAPKGPGKAPEKQGARKKAPKKFSAVAAVKRNARERVGRPPSGKVIPERTASTQREKHKPSLADLLTPESEA